MAYLLAKITNFVFSRTATARMPFRLSTKITRKVSRLFFEAITLTLFSFDLVSSFWRAHIRREDVSWQVYVSQFNFASSIERAFSWASVNVKVLFSSSRYLIKFEESPFIKESLFMSSLYS